MKPAILEVDLNKFKNNIKAIKNYVSNKQIMPVIKANGYGTYLNKQLDIINEFNIVAVARVGEAIEIREEGYKKEILILNQPTLEDIDDILKYNITVGLSEKNFLEKLSRKLEDENKQVKIHLEIETGMNRTGIKLTELQEFIEKVKQNKNIIIEGVYTHLSSADNDDEYTKEQLNKFKEAVEICKEKVDTIKYIHSSASNGILNYKDDISNLVRPGIILYGYEPFENSNQKLKVEPICKLKTKVTFLKEIDEGESVSYSRKFIAKDKMKVATIPIGYADGLRREMLGKGNVVINGQIVPIIGTICMDSCMIDVTNIENIEIGTEVFIWDNENIKLEDIANQCNTINYEILSTISNRVERQFNY